jgi:hypothetical protein
MTNQRVLAVVNDLANDCFGYDWFDLRERIDKWMHEHPDRARELIHYAKTLLEEWDHD